MNSVVVRIGKRISVPHNSIWIADIPSYATVSASAIHQRRRPSLSGMRGREGGGTRAMKTPGGGLPGVTAIQLKASAPRSKLKVRNARIVVGTRRRRVRSIHGAVIESSWGMVPWSVSVVPS